MNTTHTPGPWIVARIIPQDGDFIRQVKAEDGPVCFVHDLSDCQQEAKANARLIAAAPDLLEALNSSTAALMDFQREAGGVGILPKLDYQIAENRAALAKVEGAA